MDGWLRRNAGYGNTFFLKIGDFLLDNFLPFLCRNPAPPFSLVPPFPTAIFSSHPLTNSAFRLHSNIISTNLLRMGSFRSQPDKDKHSQESKCANFSYAVSHMCGWRIYMEDAHIVKPELSNKAHSLFGVFDGHGGAEVSTFVERHFIEELEKNQSYKKGKYEDALRETFLKMDDLLKEEKGKEEITKIQKQMTDKNNGPKYNEDSHAGCTANVVLITPEWIYCSNAGDSRAVAYQNEKTVELSKDHKPEDTVELDRITKAGGTVSYGRVNGGLNLSRALGDLQYKRGSVKPEQQMITANPDIIRIKNENVEFIIMGCDGIWQVKTNSEMVEWIKRRLDNKELKDIVEQLLEELISKDSGNQYGMDNMSAILIRFNKKK